MYGNMVRKWYQNRPIPWITKTFNDQVKSLIFDMNNTFVYPHNLDMKLFRLP